jgi:hypothetical protein
MVDIDVKFVRQKSVALQLAAYQRLYLNGCFMLPWGRECCFFAFKQGITVITVHYHTRMWISN